MTSAPLAPTAILVVDDEETMRHFLSRGLKRLGYDVQTAVDGESALQSLSQRPVAAVVLDLRMPGLDGLAVLARIRSIDPHATVLLMTAHGNVAHAVEAMKLGAADFLQKPFELDELHLRLERALAMFLVLRDNDELRRNEDQPRGTTLVSNSASMRALQAEATLLAKSDATVLLTGESGTGKTLLARALHQGGRRSDGPFVVVNCPAIPDTLFESTLFGHEAGAFTGALQQKPGLCQRAEGGTLFFDELGELSLSAQAKLERFLQDREFTPLGGTTPKTANVRVLAATNRDLEAMAQQGAFRHELLWRLKVVQLRVPSLRERREDVPLLVLQRLASLRARADKGPQSMTAEALAALAAYDWPGNVRELENLTERMAVMAGDRTVLGTGDLPAEVRGLVAQDDPGDYESARRRFDQAYFSALLVRAGGNVTEAARLGGLSRGHLHRRLRELQIESGSARQLDLGAPEDAGPGPVGE
ncbi:MAG: sigma-54 dependent transcriptional regulator [Planctomycetota bacterium]